MSDNITKLIMGAYADKLGDPEALKNLKPEDVKAMLPMISMMVLPAIDEFLQSGGEQQVKFYAQMAYQSFSELLEEDLAMGAMMLKQIGKTDLEHLLNAAKADMGIDKAMEQALSQKQAISFLSEDMHVEIFDFVRNMLPPKMKEIVEGMYNLAPDEDCRGAIQIVRQNIIDKSENELAAEYLETVNGLSVDVIYEVMSDFSDHMSVDQAAKLSESFNNSVSVSDLEDVAMSSIHLTKAFFQAAAGGQSIDFKDQAALDFQNAVKKVLAGFEMAVSQSDALPPSASKLADMTKGISMPKP